MLTVIGDLVEDIVVWTSDPVRRGTDNPATITRSRGGSAANVAAHTAVLGRSRFVGRVGDDPAGAWLTAALEHAGVDVRVQRSGRTGSVVVVIDPDDGERTMYPDRAASAQLGPIDHAWLAGTTLLHVPAYGLVSEPAAGSIVAAIGHLRGKGVPLSIDVSAVTVVEEIGRGPFVALLDRLDPAVVLANAEEADAIELLAPHTVPRAVVVVKDGPRPATIRLRDGSSRSVEPLPVPEVRDTTGAGDAFAAGFLTAWTEGADPVEACRSGHRSAAAVLRTPGAG